MQNVNNCGCCEGLSAETPVEIYNRPGLSAITYRTGNYAQFRESLLARLSTAGFTNLQHLTTRDNDDFTIALIDAWSCVADVLTFYQERIANESYLGTASEQFSLVELSRLIGYELRPGVAAATSLAFTLDENATATVQFTLPGTRSATSDPPPVAIETSVKVQSIPEPGEDAQTFETVEQVEARPQWNAIKPALYQPQYTIGDNSIAVISGTDNDLKAGDIVLITAGLKLKKILKAVVQEEAKTTWLYLDPNPILPPFAIPAHIPSGQISTYPEKTALNATIIQNIINEVWTEEDLSLLIKIQEWSAAELKESISKELAAQAASSGVIHVFRKRASVFGYNALKQVTYTAGIPDVQSAWTDWTHNESNNKIFLDSAYEQILPGSYIGVQKSTDTLAAATIFRVEDAEISSHSNYGISTKSTAITILSSEAWWESGTNLSAIRNITVHAQSVPLILATSPIAEPVTGDTILLDKLYLGVKKGKTIILTGDRYDLAGVSSAELRILKEVFIAEGVTLIVLNKQLSYSYIRTSVSINANIAAATNGETVKETLGSGDAAKAFQKFILKQPPLTFISSDSPSGTQSTLEIRVNDLLWKEASSLYAHGPGEHIYITRQDDFGRTTVIFGNGRNGSRIPTGTENIKATYRKGIGTGGLLKANQLSQLITRPLGVKGVTNPFATSGAEDRERLADARRNATLTIFALDRIVSLQDYEDFARSFAGIAKALATWTWTGQKRSVYLTVAGFNGAAIDPAGKLFEKFSNAISKAAIPEVPLTIKPYQARFFRVVARIKVNDDYITEKVLENVKSQLREKFSFAERDFGQSVALSEVFAVMQNTEGVIAVDIDAFFRSGQTSEIKNRIDAQVPVPSRSTPLPAELLMLDPGPVNLTLMV